MNLTSRAATEKDLPSDTVVSPESALLVAFRTPSLHLREISRHGICMHHSALYLHEAVTSNSSLQSWEHRIPRTRLEHRDSGACSFLRKPVPDSSPIGTAAGLNGALAASLAPIRKGNAHVGNWETQTKVVNDKRSGRSERPAV
ncbi:BZ3501_MvSof-1269-A2-R1_Chr12-1g03346 [Microbotryum saponariae]|nr:BZ3501_MvSof-1269-A2-R1_Chr12-1g03346 [Microbotryum saponariae]